ncbi:MAG: nucleoside phosphorylase [Bacteroidales bacterium]|nr:nucleoside phosphorylase [Bacteroidales bacterium]
MAKNIIEASELIINSDGSVFHLHLKPGEIADNVILVGDPGRVDMVSSYFDEVTVRAENREFRSVTGKYHGFPLTVVSTGIGTDNIDIVVNELDALVNVDFATRTVKDTHHALNLVRIGTSGSLQPELEVGSWLLSQAAIGFDGLLNFYANRKSITDNDFEDKFKAFVDWNPLLTQPYVVDGSKMLIDKLNTDSRITLGTTISAPGFYGPQGRVIRLGLADPEINTKISAFRYGERKITNYEMECSAIYGLSKLLGHNAATVCAIIANRKAGNSNADYKPSVQALVEHVLNNLSR